MSSASDSSAGQVNANDAPAAIVQAVTEPAKLEAATPTSDVAKSAAATAPPTPEVTKLASDAANIKAEPPNLTTGAATLPLEGTKTDAEPQPEAAIPSNEMSKSMAGSEKPTAATTEFTAEPTPPTIEVAKLGAKETTPTSEETKPKTETVALATEAAQLTTALTKPASEGANSTSNAVEKVSSLTSKVDALRPRRSTHSLGSQVKQVNSAKSGKTSRSKGSIVASSKSGQKSMKSVTRCTSAEMRRNPSLEEIRTAMVAVQNLPGAKLIYDEVNMERRGFHFRRQVVASSQHAFIYEAFGMTKVPVVCKVTLLDGMSPRSKENLVVNSARILRFIGGGNGGAEPPHKCFIRVYELFQIDAKMYAFMDEVRRESMLTVIKAKYKYSQEEARNWMASIGDALQFIQRRGIAHRNIKIDHVLFDKNKAVKLAGWGRSVFFWDPVKNQLQKQFKESKSFVNCHLPPEAFRGPYLANEADNWSLAVLLVAMHTRRHAFKPKSRLSFEDQWAAFSASHRISPVVADLLKSVFLPEPSKRTNLTAILASAYFKAPAADLQQPKEAPGEKNAGTGQSTGISSVNQASGVATSGFNVPLQLAGKNSSGVSLLADQEEDIEEP